MKEFIPSNTLRVFDDEPLIRDLDLAELLQFERTHEIRRLIARNLHELAMHGEVFRHRNENSGERGRPGTAYWLNESQALVLCVLSRTPVAARVRTALIATFQAFRAGKLVYVHEHHRRMPSRKANAAAFSQFGLSSFEETRDHLLQFERQPAALIEVLAACVWRLDELTRS